MQEEKQEGKEEGEGAVKIGMETRKIRALSDVEANLKVNRNLDGNSFTITKITRDTMIGEAVYEHPEIIETLLSYGVHCVGCHVSFIETLEQGLKGHARMTDEEVDKVVEELNLVIKKDRKG